MLRDKCGCRDVPDELPERIRALLDAPEHPRAPDAPA
jgi:hypothetical protein